MGKEILRQGDRDAIFRDILAHESPLRITVNGSQYATTFRFAEDLFVQPAPVRHPDLDENERLYGCVHTSNGRFLGGAHYGATQEEQEARLADPTGWNHHVNFDPHQGAIRGARTYSQMMGLSNPHPPGLNYGRVHQDPHTVRTVGRLYDSLPSADGSAMPHFGAMRDEVNKQYDFMTNRMGIKVQPVSHDPYPDVHHMMADLNNNKRLQVLSTATTGAHPLFSNTDNDKFRAVHDFFGHAATGRSFDRHGEQAAYLAHSAMFTPKARPAMASETKGQNTSLILNGHFGPQKIALLPQEHWDNSSLLNPHAARKRESLRESLYERRERQSQELRAKLAAPPPRPVASARYVLLPHWDPHRCVQIMNDHHENMSSQHTAAPQVTPELMDMAHQGGFTLHDHIGDAPQHGYMVSLAKDAEDVQPISKLTPDHIANFAAKHAHYLASPDAYMGGWLHGGNFYLDISHHRPTINRATSDAVNHKQLGIYDLARGRTLGTEEAGWITGHPGIVGSHGESLPWTLEDSTNSSPRRHTVRGTKISQQTLGDVYQMHLKMDPNTPLSRLAGAPDPAVLRNTFRSQGSHGAIIYADESNQWLMKKPLPGNEYMVPLDIATHQLMRQAGLEGPEIFAVPLDGALATAHKMYPNARQAWEQPPNLRDVTAADLETLQKHQALDWLIANHDAHCGNFLRAEAKLVGIDKGQAMKYFGRDRLTWDFHPNFYAREPICTNLWRQYAEGRTGTMNDPRTGAIGEFVARLQAVPDATLRSLYEPYAEIAARARWLINSDEHDGADRRRKLGAHTVPPNDPDAFLDALVARKASLDKDLGDLYERASARRKVVLDDPNLMAYLARQEERRLRHEEDEEEDSEECDCGDEDCEYCGG